MKHGIKKISVVVLYYPIATMLAFAAMYFHIRNGIYVTAILVYFTLNQVIKLIKNINITVISVTTILIFSYIIYCLIGFSFAVFNGYSLSISIREAANGLIPVFFFYYALSIPKYESIVFEKMFIVSCSVLIISGILYNINISDPFYIKYLTDVYPNFSLHGFKLFPRLTSTVGSVIIGSISCFSTVFAFLHVSMNKKARSNIVFIILSVFGALLSMQRSAFIAVTVNTILCLRELGKQGYFKKWQIYGLVSGFFVLIIILFVQNEVLLNTLIKRLISFNSAISERSSAWTYAWGNSFFETIFGRGYGVGGHRAIGHGITINDGNYFKMIYEMGILGFALFFIIVFSSIIKGRISCKEGRFYLIALYGVLFQAIGSNVLTFQMISPLFWYCIGRIEKFSQKSSIVSVPTVMGYSL